MGKMRQKTGRWCKIQREGSEWLITYVPESGGLPVMVILQAVDLHDAKIQAREFCHLSTSQMEFVEVSAEEQRLICRQKWLRENQLEETDER